ncbi:MAG: beta-glucosidase [Deltaproteobacteria bacterium]|nr:beta-glucosidase [Deltaproteobacteria bacterium]
MPLRSDFPDNFLWGTATAAYQIEGAHDIDGRKASIWDTFCNTPGKIKNGDTGKQTCNHYHLYQSDIAIMKAIGFNAYRFSISWPRVIPNGRGTINQRGLDFYDRLVDCLLENNIKPWVTLYHWDLPQTLQDIGGWNNRDIVYAFVDYAQVIARHLGDRVSAWMTHNEPWCISFLGNYFGLHAPGNRDLDTALRVSHHLLLSHGLATQSIRATIPNAQVGIVLNLVPVYAATNAEADVKAASRYNGFANRWFLDPLYSRGYPLDMLNYYKNKASKFESVIINNDLNAISTPTDFLGINYYSRFVVSGSPPSGLLDLNILKVGKEHTYLDWEVYPEGLTEILTYIYNNYKPNKMYVTENGATYNDNSNETGFVNDEARRFYLERHIAACQEAILHGIPLSGYFIWSLLDNFEWAEGFEKRFGIVRVDYQTFKRTIKSSGNWLTSFLQK